MIEKLDYYETETRMNENCLPIELQKPTSTRKIIEKLNEVIEAINNLIGE